VALDPVGKWKDKLLAMGPASSPSAGAKSLADFYGDMADKIEGVPGSPGIFTFNRAMFATQLVSMGFNPDPSAPSWANTISTAWQTAVGISTITPGTVNNPTWTASGVDSLTVPTGTATIITLSLAKATLQAGLIASASSFQGNTDSGIEKYAEAFYNATKQFQFLTIGLVATPGGPVPVPIPTPSK
jgi:hypothetical protein